MGFKYIFGPVPSRRLGLSLGVDLIPHKKCSLNCVYCECGPTTELTIDRKEYVPVEEVLSEIDRYLAQKPNLDFITFSGAGEPLLHSRIGDIIGYIKKKYPYYKIALLTNSTLLSNLNILDEIKGIDVILPSLDACSQKIFKIINRPHPSLRIDEIIKGLSYLKEYPFKIWLEIFIIPGINDSQEELKLIKENINIIKPHKVQLNTLDRPGTEKNIIPASFFRLKEIASFLGKNTEIIASKKEVDSKEGNIQDIETTIISTIKRRPCTLEDLCKIVEGDKKTVSLCLHKLAKEGKIQSYELARGKFFKYIG